MNYEDALKEIQRLIKNSDPSKVLQDVVDFLYRTFNKYSWVGIYILRGEYLILGSWCGEQATEHTKIPVGVGVCGSAVQSGKIEVVGDVSKEEQYLACFMSTKSEIVVPIKRDKKIVGEIDIDSDELNAFDSKDVVFLEKVSKLISNFL